jgi:hypothetical protein
MEALTYAPVYERLGKLKLDRVAAVLDDVAEDAAKGEAPYVGFLDKLLEEEVTTRLARTVEMRTKLARFAFIKALDRSDFTFQPSIDERLVRELVTFVSSLTRRMCCSWACRALVRRTAPSPWDWPPSSRASTSTCALRASSRTFCRNRCRPAWSPSASPDSSSSMRWATSPSAIPPPTSCSNWWDAATNAAPSSAPPPRATAIGATSSATRSWRRRSRTAFSTTR